MAVLFLDHPEADFLAAQLYLGLCEELGPEHVLDYPYKRSYHGEHHTYPSVYSRGGQTPCPWDYFNHWEMTSQGPMGHTSPFAWMRAQPGREWGRDEVMGRLGEFGLAILASPRTYNGQALVDLLNAAGDRMPPLVMVDGEDYEGIRYDFIERFAPRVYFKREHLSSPVETWGLEKRRLKHCPPIVPFPFASPLLPREPVAKDIDILFLGGQTWPGREEVTRVLANTFGPRFVGGHLAYDAYLDALARAKIAVSVRGYGYDTLRYWEIPSFDTMLLADRLPLVKPHPFEDGVHAAYFGNAEELVQKARYYLDHDEERQRIARTGNAHLRQHHTARARAKQLLDQSPRR